MKISDQVKTQVHFRKGSNFDKVFDLVYLQDKSDSEATSLLGWDIGKFRSYLRGVDKRILQVQSKFVVASPTSLGSSNTSVDMSVYVPIEDGYIPRRIGRTTDLKMLEKAYRRKSNVLVTGETGTGKTACVNHFAYANKLPYARINLNAGTTVEDLLGHWVPTTDKSYKWQDGVLTTFVRYGGVMNLDELNACPAEIMFCLHSLTDKSRSLTLTNKDGEVIRAHPNFFLVACMNPSDYEGTKLLNAAFKSRFRIKLKFSYDPKIEQQLVKDDSLHRIAAKLRVMKEKGELVTPVSTRELIYFKENEEDFGRKEAIEQFLNCFEDYEREAIKNVVEMMEKTPSQAGENTDNEEEEE